MGDAGVVDSGDLSAKFAFRKQCSGKDHMKFSANLGFLWTDRTLPQAIKAAKAAGFDAVECHWPYEVPPTDIIAALDETGMEMLGLNTRKGDSALGQNGFCALPGRETEARASIDEAIIYAKATRTKAVHVMAGFTSGPRAHATFCENLIYACNKADGMTILIEPLNHYDAPGYFLSTANQAVATIRELDLPNLKLMFDCYHLQIMDGDMSRLLEKCLPVIGHIQFASVPDRGPPDHGELDYQHVFARIGDLGWSHPLGAEYKPKGATGESLGWMSRFKQK
jgi:2-dehydrotetronate isomerase